MSARSTAVWHVVAWLPAVRWASCVVPWGAAIAVWLLPQLDLSLREIVPFVLGAAICRTAATVLTHRGHAASVFAQAVALCADAVLLTGLLDITGGPFNPFIVMFAAYVWLAAVTVSRRLAVFVGTLSAAGFSWLVFDHVQAGLVEHHRINDFPAHLFTMWTSGAAVAELAADYVARARMAIADRQALLDEARDRAVRSEHLAALTTLAAGAAHELSTPLGTIAVAARELERQAGKMAETLAPVASLRDDARLIRTEVDRCQAVLDGMSARAPDGVASLAAPLAPTQLVDAVRGRLPKDRRERLQIELSAHEAPAIAGVAMIQAISALLKNAFDASDAVSAVRLRVLRHGPMLRVEVQDHGAGMSTEVLRRAGEPFYSTKDTGQGLGLGLFLTRALAEQAGGSLRLEVGDGTTAILEVPVVST